LEVAGGLAEHTLLVDPDGEEARRPGMNAPGYVAAPPEGGFKQ
jgi:hypothetical protein